MPEPQLSVRSARVRDLAHELARRERRTVAEIVVRALEAYRSGEAPRDKAGLNFGDCFSYALAKATGEALLFKGEDLALTDIRSA